MSWGKIRPFLFILTISISLWAIGARANGIIAGMCPDCYGFKKIDDYTFAEKDINADDINKIKTISAAGSEQVRKYFPDFKQNARIIVCTNLQCDTKIGLANGARALTYGDNFILFSSRGLNNTIFAHEFTHVAIHNLILKYKKSIFLFPAWFDEGMAVIVSKDERYLHIDKSGEDACKNKDIKNLPVTNMEWGDAMGQNGDIYARAGCRVALWVAKTGGEKAIYQNILNIIKTNKFEE